MLRPYQIAILEEKIMNRKAIEQLEFNTIKAQLSDCAISEEGKALIDALEPSNDRNRIGQTLVETTEARAIINKTSAIPLQKMVGLQNILEKVSKNLNLTPEELTTVADGLRNIKRLKQFMEIHENLAPTISKYAYSMYELPDVIEEIDHAIKNNRVIDEASNALEKVRKRIYIAEDRLKSKLDAIVKSQQNKTYLQESIVSKRDNHYVIAVKNEYKHMIQGTIIGKSSTGSTVFMEPAQVTKLHGELNVLKIEEENEVYQILATLTAHVAMYHQQLVINAETLSTYDFIFAKGKLSKRMGGNTAEINYKGYTHIVKGKHPLIGSECVPLDFTIGDDYKALVITGPNTGGKTVALKTVGLLTLMIQSGLHVPVGDGSHFAIYSEILVDIGDGQSIEQSLSTFSSHITNIIELLRSASKYALVILDEIGSGTDPMEGEGLAIALLKTFYQKKSTIIATSHYSKVKHFAYETEDFKNGKMVFDIDTLRPKYKLEIGEAGESNAFIIALKLGMDKNIIELAHEVSYDEIKDYDHMIKDFKQKNKTSQPPAINKAKRPKAMDSHKIEKPVEQTDDSFNLGDIVFVHTIKKRGIIAEIENKKGEYMVKVGKINMPVHKKRLSLFLDKKHLYPEDYDFDIVLKSKSYRKKDHLMSRKYDPNVRIEHDKE